jgi:hypothetical protein
MTMSKITSLTLLALLLTASGAMARDKYFTDYSKPCGGYDCNSQAGQRAFWDNQQEHHGD